MDSMNEAKEFFVNLGINLDTYEPKPKWISVDDRLPKSNEEVIVCYRCNTLNHLGKIELLPHVTHATYHLYDDITYWENDCGGIQDVTHWMPLPEPPEE